MTTNTVGGLDLSYLRPMLCSSEDAPPFGPKWAAEGKLDGWRFIVVRTDDGVKSYGGRNASSYSGMLPYLDESLMYLPVGTVLDGELMHDLGFDAVGSVMKSNVPHKPSVGDQPLSYIVFDMLAMGGRDMRKMAWSERRQVIETLADGLAHVQISETYDVSDEAMAAKSLEAAIDNGLEGLVCKRRDSHYSSTRSKAWVKVKPQQTADAKVVGFKPGKAGSRWAGKVGAFEVELIANGARTTIKCGTDEAHEEAHAHPERWLGKIIEFKHHGLGRDGVPRHPTSPRRRDDLAPRIASKPKRAPSSAVAPKQSSTIRPGGWSKRNYGAMHDEKLKRCLSELEGGYGDAYQRCMAKGGDPQADLAVARNVAAGRNL